MVQKIWPADELQLREIEAVGKDAMRFKEGDQLFLEHPEWLLELMPSTALLLCFSLEMVKSLVADKVIDLYERGLYRKQ